jgi:DNA (cytosine-5)-methyltransferase 1
VRDQARWAIEPRMERVVDGVPNRVDRLRAIGNAVVPAIPEIIGRAIMIAEKK